MPEIEFEIRGSVATIALNRPDRMNALAGTMRADIEARLKEAEAHDGVRAVVITGRGRAFCAGGDLKLIDGFRREESAGAFRDILEQVKQTVLTMRRLAKPIVARINGPAVGAGMNLALACDLRVASEKAKFGQPFLKVGLHPDWGGTFWLRGAAAQRLFFTGEIIDAAAADRLGLLTALVPDTKLDATVSDLCNQLGAVSPSALAETKRSLFEMERPALEAALTREMETQLRLLKSPDLKEGIAAFLEKRPPKFRH